MPPGIPRGAMCVQRFDDSRNSAIHTTYRISLRSSSMREPRDPLLKVLNICVYVFYTFADCFLQLHFCLCFACRTLGRRQPKAPMHPEKRAYVSPLCVCCSLCRAAFAEGARQSTHSRRATKRWLACALPHSGSPQQALHETAHIFSNDPSAGSPTETLLRLLLPLNDQV